MQIAVLTFDGFNELDSFVTAGILNAKLGLIGDLHACTDLTTQPWVIEAGIDVLDAPFVAHGNVATAVTPFLAVARVTA